MRPVAYAAHVLTKLMIQTLGRLYVSSFAARLVAATDPAGDLPDDGLKVALVAHVFHPEISTEVLACLAHLPSSAALIVTTSPDKEHEVLASLVASDRAQVICVPNRGRDVAPFLHLLQSGQLDRFDVVLKLHSKRSVHLIDGDLRRNLLFTSLAGSKRRVKRVLRAFANPRTGMVGWKLAWRTTSSFWFKNKSYAESVADKLGLQKPLAVGFFEGTMFWVRPAALELLKSPVLEPERFEPEKGQLDATLHHVMERLFPHAVTSLGFDVRDTAGNVLTSSSFSWSSGLSDPAERRA